MDSCEASAFVGFEVSFDDFIEVSNSHHEECAHGHIRPVLVDGRYCPKDGTAFEIRECWTQRPSLATFCELLKRPAPKSDDQADLQWWWDMLVNDRLTWVWVKEHGRDVLIYGRMFAYQTSHGEQPDPYITHVNDLTEAVSRVEYIRDQVFPDGEHPVRFYLMMNTHTSERD